MSTPTSISIPKLRADVSGQVIGPDDAEYDRARAVFYGGFDLHPAVVVRVADEMDVARVIALARETGLELAVRSGGHSVIGQGVSDGGIVIDLADLRSIEVDPEERTAWAQTGLTALEFTNATHAHGLGVGFGDTGSVGIGGITLGGGVGYLVRKHGLTIDSLLAAEIVTADGELHRVDAEHEPDLFWAIRGGGGNFGVATRFRFALHPLDTVVGGMLLLPATVDTIEGFMAEAEAAPEELSSIANVMRGAADAVRARGGARQARDHGAHDLRGRRRGRPGGARAVPSARRAARRHAPADAVPRGLPAGRGGLPPGRDGAHDVRRHDRPSRGRDDPRAPRDLDRDDGRGAAADARRGDGARAGRGDRVRAPSEQDHGELRRRVRTPRGDRGARPLGRGLRVGAEAGRRRRLRQLPGVRRRGADPRRLPRGDLGPAAEDQGALRPDEPVPSQPEHPARQRRRGERA